MVWDVWCFEDFEEKDDSVDQSVNDAGDCRTAPAEADLLKT